jgi:hypothetical protein
MIPFILLPLLLGLKDFEIARIVTCGCLLGAISMFWGIIGYLLEKFKKKSTEINLNLEENFKFRFCSLENLRFWIKKPKNIFQILYQGIMGCALGGFMADFYRADANAG